MSDWRIPSQTALKHYRVAVVSAEFNKEYSDLLLKNTLEGISSCGIAPHSVTVVRVPGSFELPFACARFLNSGNYDGIIALGILLRGATSHFEHVARATAQGIQELNLRGNIPVIFGVLTCDTPQQIEERLVLGNNFANAVVQMMNFSGA